MSLDWKDVAQYAGVLLAAPVAFVWRRAVGAVQKPELMEVVKELQNQRAEDRERFEQHCKEDRERFGGLFARVGEVAGSVARIEGYMQAMKDEEDRRK